MSENQQENEVKFLLSNIKTFESHLIQAGATLHAPRVHEINLRFDTPDLALTAAHRVLRLREDTRARLTYKGPADPAAAIASRKEIEFEVSNFSDARDFLLALGYHVSVSYEKFRTTYLLEGTEVDLDEMPYGNFCEIEGRGEAAIRIVSQKLGLTWESRSLESYMMLFDRVKSSLDLKFNDLTFENFSKIFVSPVTLGLKPAE